MAKASTKLLSRRPSRERHPVTDFLVALPPLLPGEWPGFRQKTSGGRLGNSGESPSELLSQHTDRESGELQTFLPLSREQLRESG